MASEPRQPMSAYGLWFAGCPEDLKQAAGTGRGAVCKVGGQRWRTMSDEDKKPHEERAAELWKEHARAVEEFKAAGGIVSKRQLRPPQCMQETRAGVAAANGPKQPPRNGYQLWLSVCRAAPQQVAGTGRGAGFKVGGERWSTMSDAEKKPHEERAAELWKEYVLAGGVVRKRLLRRSQSTQESRSGVSIANGPKQPPRNGYQLWLSESRAALEQEAGTGRGAVFKAGGERWRTMSEAEQKPHEERAAELWKEYVRVVGECKAPVRVVRKRQRSRSQSSQEGRSGGAVANGPPRPPRNGYQVWFSEFRAALMQEAGTGRGSVFKVGGQRWRTMSEAEKKPHEERAADLWKKYALAVEEFKAAGGVVRQRQLRRSQSTRETRSVVAATDGPKQPPMDGFQLWLSECSSAWKQEAGPSRGDVDRIAREKWAAVPRTEKNKYDRRASGLYNQSLQALCEFKAAGGAVRKRQPSQNRSAAKPKKCGKPGRPPKEISHKSQRSPSSPAVRCDGPDTWQTTSAEDKDTYEEDAAKLKIEHGTNGGRMEVHDDRRSVVHVVDDDSTEQ